MTETQLELPLVGPQAPDPGLYIFTPSERKRLRDSGVNEYVCDLLKDRIRHPEHGDIMLNPPTNVGAIPITC